MLEFSPQYQQRPWGSDRLAYIFSRKVPKGTIGEAWELGELDEFHACVADGPLQGQELGKLWRQGLLGGSAKGTFPFLLKWLDTAVPLSVQVHPSAKTCRQNTNDRSKTEAWFVAHAESGACLFAGFQKKTNADEITQACKNGNVAELLCPIYPQIDDMLLIPAGTVHALGAGFLILEVQEPSDTTFRLYDWDRLGLDNKPRALHLEAGTQAIDYQNIGPPQHNQKTLNTEAFCMQKIRAEMSYSPKILRVFASSSDPLVLTNGQDRFSLQKGEIRIAEHIDGPLTLASGSGVLITEGQIV